MNILVTGGAGYVGSIVAQMLLEEGHQVIIFDDLQRGHSQAVLPEAELLIGDICNAEGLDSVFERSQTDAVVHMAAETEVQYSMTDAKRYFRNNIVGGINLLDTMLKHNVLNGECEDVFFNQPLIIVSDTRHSKKEKRYSILFTRSI